MNKLNKNRPGYKKTKVGWIPEEWVVTPVGQLLEFKNGLNKAKEFFGKGTPIVNYMDVLAHSGLFTRDIAGKVTVTTGELRNYHVQQGDVFFTRTSETVEEIGMSSVMLDNIKDSVFSGFVLRGRTINNKLELFYKKYCFRAAGVRKQIITTCSYTTRALTNGKLLSKVYIPLPPLPEQNEIAKILSVWDKAIEHSEKLIIAKAKFKKAIMQQILTGNHRFKGFKKSKWQKMKLQDILKPVSRPVPRPDKEYLALGIRSHGKGTFLRTVDNPTEVMMDTLYEVRENDLIVNITFAWEGAIAIVNKSDEGALVSHRFPTYVFKKDKATPKFFRHIILTKQFVHKLGLISPGGAGRNRVMSKKDFLNLVVSIPQLPEQ